ncbi:MAG: HU family DNA-binding protein, partial [Gammaproteobacteria bacterium]|nr:HU family DNA-binding protein [Gammaproteobacteria bacterium]
IKVRRVSKKATKARKGVNPFTGQPMTIKAKPARKAARATALKALKDLVN